MAEEICRHHFLVTRIFKKNILAYQYIHVYTSGIRKEEHPGTALCNWSIVYPGYHGSQGS